MCVHTLYCFFFFIICSSVRVHNPSGEDESHLCSCLNRASTSSGSVGREGLEPLRACSKWALLTTVAVMDSVKAANPAWKKHPPKHMMSKLVNPAWNVKNRAWEILNWIITCTNARTHTHTHTHTHTLMYTCTYMPAQRRTQHEHR